LPIWIDGVVMKVDDIAKQRELGVTAGRPKGQIAWKFDSSGAETVLEGVVVSGGHTGGLYPTAQLRPVDIGGTTVSNASLANYDEIERLDVAIGDSVWVVKANDIIPKIIRVTERAATRKPILAPAVCPFCGGEVGRRRTTGGEDGVIIECRNAECPKKSTGKIRRWIASLDILGIGDVVLESMIERFDLADAADLYTLRGRADELADLVTHAERDLRLGEKRTASILDAIDGTRALSLSQFLGSLGLDHLGKRRVELMMKSANGLLDRLEDWRSGLLRDPANAVKAGVPNIGGAIQDGIDAMSTVIDKLIAAGVTATPNTKTTSANSDREAAPLLTVCISGKLLSGKKKSDYEQPLLVAGYELVEDVTKGLNYLVLADPASNSSKAEKARKLGVTVISEEQLTEMVTSVPQQVQVVPEAIQTVEEIPMRSNSASFKFDGQFQRFEFVDEKSSKFWEIRVEGASVQVRYGKIGTAGQKQTKEFDDESAALKHAEKMVGEKLKGGYVPLSNATKEAGEQTKQVAQKSSTIDMAKKLKLDKKQVLTGDFPKDLDFGDLQLDFEIFVHEPEVFSRAAKKGMAPQANLTIANNSALETLRIGCDDLGMSYVLIENCANLKSIEVYLKSPRSDAAEPKWLICKDLPKLESFVAAGSLLSIEIEAARSLKMVKVGECARLGLLSLNGTPSLEQLDINGCSKLPWVQGLTERQEVQLSVESQVDVNCSKPVEPTFPFSGLNFRQVNEILEVINKGLMTDFERGRPNRYDEDPSIQQYAIQLLRPLEYTNTGGSGELYAYELVKECGVVAGDLSGSARGEHSPEECLNSALRSVTDFIIIDGVDDQSETVVFDYLKMYGNEKAVSEKQNENNALAGSEQASVAPSPSPIATKAAKPKEVPVESPSKSAKPAGTSTAKTVCISGKLLSGKKKADYEAPLRAVGIELVDDVIQGLAYLVLADPSSASSKAVKAKKLGVEVISEEQLMQMTDSDRLTANNFKKGNLEVGSATALRPDQSVVHAGGNRACALPKEFIAIQKLWIEIVFNLKKVDSKEGRELIELYERRLSAGRFGFDPIISPVEPSQMDRLGNVLRGPVYACDGYEWPTQSGYPMVPFIQLDLEYCGRVGGVELGSGLLQAFMGHGKISPEDALIRVIPRSSISRERLLPVPEFGNGIKAFSDVSWATQEYDAEDEDCQALQIVNFARPRFGISRIEKMREFDDMKSLRTMGLTDELIKKWDALADALGKKFQPTAFHLFGTFFPIQYVASERSTPLFCFESEKYGFNFGDGNGQIFYDKLKSGDVVFSFDWSCY
jgi:NAD-dependent DNA ligase/predicted DNA-binding WGR domain protein